MYPTKKPYCVITAKFVTMKFIAKSNRKLIEAGTHLATIEKVYSDTASTGADQLAVKFNANGNTITRWYNLQGFQVDKNQPTTLDSEGRSVPNYLRDKKGNRLEDTAKTEKCISIIQEVGLHAGLQKDTEFEAQDLEGREVGILVDSEDEGYGERLFVKWTLSPSKVSVTAESF